MKITVIYGEDAINARRRFSVIVDTIHKRGWEVVSVEGDKQTIVEKLTHTSLFGDNQLFTIENAKLLDTKTLEWLGKHAESFTGNLLIYHEGSIPIKTLNVLKKTAKLEKFDLPKTIFVFLENLVPGNSHKSMQDLHKLVEREPVELVFALMCGLYRDLYWAKVDPASLALPDWRARKLKAQAAKYSEEQLKEIINQLADIDIQAKTSKGELLSSLDLLIAMELQ